MGKEVGGARGLGARNPGAGIPLIVRRGAGEAVFRPFRLKGGRALIFLQFTQPKAQLRWTEPSGQSADNTMADEFHKSVTSAERSRTARGAACFCRASWGGAKLLPRSCKTGRFGIASRECFPKIGGGAPRRAGTLGPAAGPRRWGGRA